MKKCEACRFGLFDDHGYSNWTVEGTRFFCLKKLHPKDGFDRFYGEDKRLEFAEQCAGFSEGVAVSLDCDRENRTDYNKKLSDFYTTDPEVKPLLDIWEKG